MILKQFNKFVKDKKLSYVCNCKIILNDKLL